MISRSLYLHRLESISFSLQLSLLVPNIMAGRIIGKGGEKIKAIKLSSNCNVNVANEPIVRLFSLCCLCYFPFFLLSHRIIPPSAKSL